MLYSGLNMTTNENTRGAELAPFLFLVSLKKGPFLENPRSWEQGGEGKVLPVPHPVLAPGKDCI